MRWKVTLPLAAIVATTACASMARDTGQQGPGASAVAGELAGSELAAFTDDAFYVRTWRSEDLDGDGDRDVVAILEEKTKGADRPRTLLVLRRSADGRLERTVENRNAIPPASHGGTLGDPLRELVAHKGGFALIFEGGSRELWSRRYAFDYVPARKTWMLTTLHTRVLDRHEGDAREKQFGVRDFGNVSVSEFDPQSLPDAAQNGASPPSTPVGTEGDCFAIGEVTARETCFARTSEQALMECERLKPNACRPYQKMHEEGPRIDRLTAEIEALSRKAYASYAGGDQAYLDDLVQGLREANSAWKRHRDAECQVQPFLEGMSRSEAGDLTEACRLELTRKRISELETTVTRLKEEAKP